MFLESLSPGGHGAGFEPVAAADEGFEGGDVGALCGVVGGVDAGFGFAVGEGGEGGGDVGAGFGTEAVVVEDEVLQGDVLAEEIDEGGLGFEAEGVVAEIDGGEVLEGEERGEEGG